MPFPQKIAQLPPSNSEQLEKDNEQDFSLDLLFIFYAKIL